MYTLIQSAISGLLMGGVYAIIALGLSLIFGVMKLVNFAHGDFLMAFCYVAWAVVSFWNVDPYLSILIIAPISFIVGYMFQKIFINGILRKEKSTESPNIRLFTVGFAWSLGNLALLLFGANIQVTNTAYKGSTFFVGDYMISIPRLIAFAIALFVTAILFVFLYKTETGRALRAISQNRFTARLMGIDVERLYCIAFGIGIMVVGISACLIIPFYSVFPTMGSTFGLRSFVIVVLGGMGNLPGALISGLFIGLLEAFVGTYLSTTYANMIIFIVFIIALVVRSSNWFQNRLARA
jgi:branched-chain amino acid transport system permease protein